MPELAEVETTKRDLKKILIGKRICKVEVFLDKIVYNKKDEFIKSSEGQTVLDVKRRGKWLLFELDSNYIIIHFRMEGRFYLLPLNEKRDKHDYVIFYFDDFSLHFNDPRLFGKLEVIKKDDLEKFFLDKKLGLEYTDSNLTPEYLKRKFKTHHTDIKKMLLDQSYVTGIGNIYADEILFLCKINPLRKCNTITEKEAANIIKFTRKVLEKAIKMGGTTIRTYSSVDGVFQQELLVHGKDNGICPECHSKIQKIRVGGRGTYYCEKCQK